MDRAQLVLVALPIFLFCRDIFNLFTPRPPKPTQYHYHQIDDPHEPDNNDDLQTQQQQILQEPLKFPVQQVYLSLSNPKMHFQCFFFGNLINAFSMFIHMHILHIHIISYMLKIFWLWFVCATAEIQWHWRNWHRKHHQYWFLHNLFLQVSLPLISSLVSFFATVRMEWFRDKANS